MTDRKFPLNIDRFSEPNRTGKLHDARLLAYLTRLQQAVYFDFTNDLPDDYAYNYDKTLEFARDIEKKYPIDDNTWDFILYWKEKLIEEFSHAPESNPQVNTIPATLHASQIVRDDLILQAKVRTDSKTNAKLFELYLTGEIKDFLTRFFRATDPNGQRQEFYTANVLAFLQIALTQGDNIVLQNYYSQDDPKQLRGKLTKESNPVFKDTDTLIDFLSKHYFLEY